ncbi:VirB3 family type IV secretion system protein [Azohydromonas australica]|uniref:VirB3 family type IV secretion system protein n=1 Tax=Azohydromonas australica TaxID=364039 RepID=UPI00040EFADC|nr:VirB3 family type IV secretion system protein [Azohydromonas australica]
MQKETIYKGATRPALLFGRVPLLPGVFLGIFDIVATMLVFIFSSLLLACVPSLIVFPVLAWLTVITKRDDQALRQMRMVAFLNLRNPNQKIWGVRSYSPIDYSEKARLLPLLGGNDY